MPNDGGPFIIPSVCTHTETNRINNSGRHLSSERKCRGRRNVCDVFHKNVQHGPFKVLHEAAYVSIQHIRCERNTKQTRAEEGERTFFSRDGIQRSECSLMSHRLRLFYHELAGALGDVARENLEL